MTSASDIIGTGLASILIAVYLVVFFAFVAFFMILEAILDNLSFMIVCFIIAYTLLTWMGI